MKELPGTEKKHSVSAPSLPEDTVGPAFRIPADGVPLRFITRPSAGGNARGHRGPGDP